MVFFFQCLSKIDEWITKLFYYLTNEKVFIIGCKSIKRGRIS